ncbi:MAG: hypothetical protein IPH16_07195 [Haliscomenobacter sp.]|nr:hypothetical protein [Haliscomenobacter sp.]
MAYNNAINAYVLKTPLKQGFYDYAYAMTPETQKKGGQSEPAGRRLV